MITILIEQVSRVPTRISLQNNNNVYKENTYNNSKIFNRAYK